ncbi:FliM/FliN family flagellar motor switch protein [Pluralibacter sp.]|jgi:flagellar motor switch protein FliN/FliY|uniref:FliM/FliN family flagellar motor switch protein n=1 Tax=Pluralibacter sp. TaxID=1920032 RepID=UPI0025D32F37|nr:FliM/FliN family flagellar motor switch protein [Pluralibacter sp.]MBV8043266.1 FliM/FliN family flagellar motor switch protein [Pluralibacter sp.]
MAKTSNIELDMAGLDVEGFDDLFASGEEGFSESEPAEKVVEKRPLSFFHRLPVNLSLEVASTEIPLEELMTLAEGAVVQMNKLSHQSLDVKVNGILIGAAEVVIVDGHYGLRMTELFDDINWSTLA